MSIYLKKLSTPAGALIAGVDDTGIWLCDYEQRSNAPRILQRISDYSGQDFKEGLHPLHTLLEDQITSYFEGALTKFNLPLQLAGSHFQQKVWELLLAIPYGETRTYKQQALTYGDEKAIRAVASANGANAISIIIPCHRVIGKNSSLTGYAGGLQSKQWLLKHERKHYSGTLQSSLF